MHAFIALHPITCFDPSNYGTCFLLPVADSTQTQPDGSKVIMMGCMGTNEMNSTKRLWQEHQSIEERWLAGYRDTVRALNLPGVLERAASHDAGIFIFDL
jgi:hypothetical protein